MSSEPAVRVRGLGKRYRISAPGSQPGTLAEALLKSLRGGIRAEDFWALREIDFTVNKGEVVGLVGHNGAGKSTLLKLLSRITEPTEGEIALYGRVGSLLEVGSGFHPELTGRENIFMNGSILGMKRTEIQSCFDEIVDFAGERVQLHLDSPVKRWSSGMVVRLAFAVAAHLNPEILIVDEVLAVGDAEFQKRCLGKMQDVARGGRTVFFVSHNLAAVTALCTRGILLKGGRIHLDASVDKVAAEYQRLARAGMSEDGRLDHVSRAGSGVARFTHLESMALSSVGEVLPVLTSGGDLKFEVDVATRQSVKDATARLFIADPNTYRLIEVSADRITLDAGESARIGFHLKDVLLRPGLYTVGLWLGRSEADVYDSIEYAAPLELAVGADTPVGSGAYACRCDVDVQVARAIELAA
ncbi:MAG: ABC transporter ATP-binding protein [Armatimonas sp.]